MNWIQAVLIGLVEGITEYLPVSSTGHIIMTQRVLGIPADEAANAFSIVIQIGAILAVLGLYKERVKSVLTATKEGIQLLICLIVAFLPAAVIGLAFNDTIDQYLFGLRPIIAAWILGGIVILALSKKLSPDPDGDGLDLHQLTWQKALGIGFFQCLAMWPGTSRSLMTIIGARFAGLRLAAAVEFSFLLGVVTLSAASGYSALKHHEALLQSYSVSIMLLGILASWVSAAIAVKWMVSWINQRGMAVFAYWRFIIAAVAIAMVSQGYLE